ncbi:hypothetical protein GGI25_005857 [Coemansia spiralis]|uniref:Succinate dehydrogenase assembly factor 3 n=2 Tax=Coemansia TaxID=4863 RepID=A0A9W8KVV2_9FUNG|nr:hypothetical protein BX070DRAFT_225586 [Coemansia spiralis]KAJ1988605.1 hypothetical protein EDC05_005210 [Coemansia umbellata]KAJ2623402.1 hypothetical protein GGI26_002440 [Coemansia sp. RSA 1358]KAJ2670392.1 hypothetical protein GGI25_005857 [Coemansia spiralis]
MVNALHLYRHILRVHRLLPQEMRFVGDQYVRAEFRNHKTVTDKQYLEPFFSQWTSYLTHMKQQTKQNVSTGRTSTKAGGSWDVGKHLDRDIIESLEDDKAEQLLELHRTTFGADDSAVDSTEGSAAAPPKRK